MMGYLSRDAILDADDLKTRDIDVPEWGGTVRVRALTGAQRDAMEQSIVDAKGKPSKTANIRARFVSLALIDENGELLFTPQDVSKLGGKSATALNRVFDACRRLSGMTRDDVEELEGNS